MSYAGIDYGMGKTNVDTDTGIRYGVISMHELPWWCDEAEANYGPPTCPKCGNEVSTSDVTCKAEFRCPECDYDFECDEAYGDEPLSWSVDNQHYAAEQTRDDGDVFVTRSPFYTHAQFCSPCAPGAGHLGNPCEDGPKTYCFGHDWFEGDVAPYPVYRVDNNELVEPEGK